VDRSALVRPGDTGSEIRGIFSIVIPVPERLKELVHFRGASFETRTSGAPQDEVCF
jgi:hypothetical protein